MIPCPKGWTWVLRNHGVSLMPPAGPDAGGIRYSERVRPLLRAAAVLDALAADPSFRVTRRGPIEQLCTYEGEYAALVELDGLLDGVPAQRAIGLVFGDDFYAQISGLARLPSAFAEIRAVTRDLVLRDRHLLGLRRRRYLFTPPAGWHACERSPLHTHHYPPDYPRDDVELIAYPALPRALLDAADLAQAPQVLLPPGGAAVQAVLARHAAGNATLTGESWQCLTAAGRHRDVVLLGDDLYVYPLSVEAPDARMPLGRAALQAVAQSVSPLPRPHTPKAAPTEVLSHWS